MSSMNSSSPTSPASKLTRSTTDKQIAGVAGGVAAYFGIDPVIARVGFAVTALCGGAGLLAYIVMMFIVPSDDSPAVAQPATA
jgi:phage shock protein C